MLKYFIQDPTPLKRYGLRLLLTTAGYAAREVTVANEADLHYGNDPASDCPVVIPERLSDILWDDCLAGKHEPGGRLPFDIVAGTVALLTDRVNNGEGAYDEHDRLKYASSYQARSGIGTAPVVNAYVDALRVAMTPVAGEGLPLWPKGKRAVIGLSHDVDRLDQWSAVRGSLRTGRYATDAGRSVIRNFLYFHNDLRLFRELVDYEGRLGFKSTFMFASRRRYDSQTSLDVAYSVEAPLVLHAIDHVRESGFEIGLHPSYDAHKSAEQFLSERTRLERVSRSPVVGMRHHYWHTGRDVERALSHHEQAGFRYDSSIAWNEHPGFRRSVAFPYRPWGPNSQREIGVLQLPVMIMDGSLMYRPGISAEEATQSLLNMVRQLEKHQGLGVVDWHSDSSHPATPRFQKWGTTYFAFLKAISKMPEIWVTNLDEISDWWQKREESLNSR